MDNKVFYHGGVPADFTLEDIDIYRLATKQGKQGKGYAGFYMFAEDRRDGAFHYAEQTNSVENTNDKGVIRIEMDANLNIKELDRMFEIDRISQEKLQDYANQGYDLVSGKSFDGQQYVLLNKDKIRSVSFESMDRRYSEEPKQEIDVQEQQVDDIVEQMTTGQYDKNDFPILSSESIRNEQQFDKGKVYVKTKGFAKVGILGIIVTIVSVALVILGVILER